MDASTITEAISEELRAAGNPTRVAGIDIHACLVSPTLQRFKAHPPGAPDWQLWVVLEEYPDQQSSYKVAYDPESGEFCLAIGKQPAATYVGHYGSFLEALAAM